MGREIGRPPDLLNSSSPNRHRRGRSGDEVQDYDYTFTNARRHSNSSTQGIGEFKTKFETQEPEPAIGKYSDSTGVAGGAGVVTMSKPGGASGSINSEDSGLHKSSSK